MAPKKNRSSIDPEQRELIEKAQQRARQKRRLYLHFIVFLIGAVILILLNVVFEVGQDIRPLGIDWFVWAIMIWGVIFLAHLFNVFVTNRFFGKEWEDRQIEKLVARQRKRIDELEKKVEREHPLPENKRPAPRLGENPPPDKPKDDDTPIDPDKPINS